MPYINGNKVDYTHISKTTIKHFKRSLEAVVNERLNEYMNNFTSQSADAFAKGLKNRLLKRATPKDGQSQALVQEIANSIYVDKFDNPKVGSHYATVHIPIDKQNLVLYLEYGTGLAGFKDPNPDTLGGNSRRKYHRVVVSTRGVVWHYASNYATKYKKVHNPIDEKKGFGFFFGKSNLTYVDKNDLNPTWLHIERKTKEKDIIKRTKPYGPDSLGRMYLNGRTYKAKRKSKTYTYNYYYNNWVWSQGIKPIRFVYDTKRAYAIAISEFGVGGGTRFGQRLPDKARNLIEGK